MLAEVNQVNMYKDVVSVSVASWTQDDVDYWETRIVRRFKRFEVLCVTVPEQDEVTQSIVERKINEPASGIHITGRWRILSESLDSAGSLRLRFVRVVLMPDEGKRIYLIKWKTLDGKAGE